MSNSNGAIVQQLKSQQSHFEAEKLQSDQSDITEDARLAARRDAITWGKAYKKYLEDYKEEARMIINEKITGANSVEKLDLDESIFFPTNDTFFTSTSEQEK